MRTDKERSRLIAERTSEIRRARAERRRMLTDALSVAACVVFIVLLGVFLPGTMTGGTTASATASAMADAGNVSGAASLVSGDGRLGCVFMGILSFLLGVCVTMILYRLRERNREGRKKNRGDEK